MLDGERASVEFKGDTYGVTRDTSVAEADTYTLQRGQVLGGAQAHPDRPGGGPSRWAVWLACGQPASIGPG